MELFDSFFMKTDFKCPRCEEKLNSLWQSAQVVKRDSEFKEGERMRVAFGGIQFEAVNDAEVEGYTLCSNCLTLITGKLLIKNGVPTSIMDIKIKRRMVD